MRLTIEFGFTPTMRLRRPLLPFAVLAATTASAMTWLEVDKLLPSDGHEHAFFGHTVAIDDDTAIVATPFDAGAGEVGDFRGAAYVFVRDNLGNWDAQAKLLPAFSGFAHQFGYSVDIDGSTVIAGMFEEDLNPTEDAAYIFVRDASGNWREEAALTASDGIFGDGFSVSVAVDGDTAFVGTRPETFTGFVDLTGAVYVFNRDASGTWSEQAKLVASDSAIGDTFGRTLDLDGDTAIISRARDDDDGTGTVIVSAYIFTRDALGTWSEHTKLSTSERTVFEGEFGPPRPVAIDGNIAVLGTGPNQDGHGMVYVFASDPSGNWSEDAVLTSSDRVAGDGFGSSVALFGETVVVGAPSDAGLDRGGAAYVFTRDTSGQWAEQKKLMASDGESGDLFGGAAAISDDTVIVGARHHDAKRTDSGAAYVFQLSDFAEVEIKIRPHQEPNNVNPSSRQLIAVAILTTDAFDAVQVDPLSVEFGPGGAAEFHGRGHARDIDKDGDIDLMLHFRMQQTGIACGDSQARILGKTFAGESITGSDSVRPKPCR